jgi:hypothetical protein
MTLFRSFVAFNSQTHVISLTTRVFFLWRERKYQNIDAVERIDAFNRDSLTHDEVFVRFHADEGGLVISQFDHGFQELVNALTPFFPGIERWFDVTPAVPLTEVVLTLWERKGGADTQDPS